MPAAAAAPKPWHGKPWNDRTVHIQDAAIVQAVAHCATDPLAERTAVLEIWNQSVTFESSGGDGG
jgi:hypothetical protein